MGRINKTKAGVALLAGLAGFGATGVAVAQGGLTANLALSGTFFKISMTHLEGEGLSIFTDGEQMAEEAVPGEGQVRARVRVQSVPLGRASGRSSCRRKHVHAQGARRQ